MDRSATDKQLAVAAVHVEHRPSRRAVAASIFRACATTGLLIALFATAPLTARPQVATAVQLALLLVALGIVVTWQIVAVARSPSPGIRAIEGGTTSVLLLLLTFASVYYVTSQVDPAGFSERLSRFDAVYFSVTVFATVGFGDIVARSDAARIAVTAQMIVNLVMIGVIARVLLGTARRRRETIDDSRSAE